jgi:pyruvate/2-oxoglutarate dehydrogenase complex dihydrolipoamide dehydrogenase (E3) component
VYLQLRDWLARDCTAAGVALRLGTAATVDAVKALDPETVIVATGGTAAPVSIKGAGKPHVLSAQAALVDGARIGATVIVIGGGQVGVQVAARLAAGGQGRAVTVVEPTQVPELAYGLSLMERTFTLMTHLPKLGVEARMGLRIEEIRDRELLTVDAVDGAKEKLKADTVVMALPPQPDAAAAAAWQPLGCAVHVIGEAAQGRTVGDAIHEGARVAREI